MDIGVVLDSSRSVGWENYETLKRSLAKLIDYFHVSKDGTHFGFLHYNQDAILDFDFANSASQNPQALKEKILEINYDPGRTRTDKAIKMANERLFTEEGGAREGVPKLLIVLTDGKTSDDSAPYSTVLAPLKVRWICSQKSFVILNWETKTKKLLLEQFKLIFKSNPRLHWFSSTSLCDWFKKLAPLSTN